MPLPMHGMSRRLFVQGATIAGLGLMAGCSSGEPRAKRPPSEASDVADRVPDRSAPALEPVPRDIPGPVTERLAMDLLGGHDTPNPGGSRDIRQFVSDLHDLGMTTAVCIDPSSQMVRALQRARVRLIVRLVQEDNLFDERNVLWTMNKLKGVQDLSIQPFNEPNIEGADLSPEEHIRSHFLPAARIILPMIAPNRGRLLLTPLATHAPFQGVSELEGYRRMLQALMTEIQSEDSWMWSHLAIGAHVYSYYPGDDRIWPRIEEMVTITEQTIGSVLPIEITEAGLNLDYVGQYDDEQLLAETIRIVKSIVPASLSVQIQSFCLWLTANYAQRDPQHQHLGEEHKARQEELDRFEGAALRRLDGVTPLFQALAALPRQQPIKPLAAWRSPNSLARSGTRQ
jgi:hypothetical protein